MSSLSSPMSISSSSFPTSQLPLPEAMVACMMASLPVEAEKQGHRAFKDTFIDGTVHRAYSLIEARRALRDSRIHEARLFASLKPSLIAGFERILDRMEAMWGGFVRTSIGKEHPQCYNDFCAQLHTIVNVTRSLPMGDLKQVGRKLNLNSEGIEDDLHNGIRTLLVDRISALYRTLIAPIKQKQQNDTHHIIQ